MIRVESGGMAVICRYCESVVSGEHNDLQDGFFEYQDGNYTKALHLLLPCAEEGKIVAQCLIGSLYQLGFGTHLNGPEAVKWYFKAGRQGCGLAYHNLATIYSGTLPDVAPDSEKAGEYRAKATANGFPNFWGKAECEGTYEI
jgi:TPR repeat protein